MMRTTLNLPDDVYELARSIAALKRISLGEALAELIRRGAKPSRMHTGDSLFPRFTVSETAEPITLEETLDAEDDL